LADEETGKANQPDESAKDLATVDELATPEKRIAELTNDLKRLQADFDNYKKRSEKEWAERSKTANQRLMTELLPILDSFDKAIEDAGKNGSAQSIKEGLKGLHKQLLQALQREGLKEISTKDKFDPFMHEAMMREEKEGSEDGKILEVYQKGYAIGNRAIRPAKVKVARKKEPEEAPDKETVEIHDNPKDKTGTETERGDDEDDSIKG